jgi:hypothetical protein
MEQSLESLLLSPQEAAILKEQVVKAFNTLKDGKDPNLSQLRKWETELG